MDFRILGEIVAGIILLALSGWVKSLYTEIKEIKQSVDSVDDMAKNNKQRLETAEKALEKQTDVGEFLQKSISKIEVQVGMLNQKMDTFMESNTTSMIALTEAISKIGTR